MATFEFIFLAKNLSTQTMRPHRLIGTGENEEEAAAAAALQLQDLIGPYELRRLESRRIFSSPQSPGNSFGLASQLSAPEPARPDQE